MRAPSAAKSSAISRPMPLPAPVTTATRSVRSTSSSCSVFDGTRLPSSIAHMESSRARGSDLGRSPARGTEGSPSPTSTARSSSTAACSGSSSSGAGVLEDARSPRSSACRRRRASTSRCSGIPGSETQVELLEYRGCEQVSGAAPPSHHGTGHFCVFVDDIDGAPRRSRREGRPLPLRRAGRDARPARTGAARASTRSIRTGTSSSSTSGRPRVER